MRCYLRNLWLLCAALSILLTVTLGSAVEQGQASLSQRLVRLHVVGASNSTQEQAVKLEVRDAVTALLEPRLENCGDVDEARQTIADSLPAIEETAKAVYGGDVRVSLAREDFPARAYDGFALPAGSYESLRVTLGAGEGRNWWCVVFPPLCAADSVEARAALEELGEDEAMLVTGDGVMIRFKFVEWLEKIMRLF